MSDAVFSASFVRFSMLVDGSLRVVIDVDPAEVPKALAGLNKPGIPLAIARLTNQAAVEHDRSRMAEEPADPLPAHKLPTPLSSRVAMTCNESSFRDFLSAFDTDGFSAVVQSGCVEPVKQYVRDFCDVNSRAEIKPGTPAAQRWETLRAEYEFWQRERAA
ncbi:hypothetical protein LNAOJCKE_0903 [Methylorubrum aminovorans]|uniref:Uncharacterized protein n=2 Tax=Methylorubrum aminovorans TaxID=269069 RepID=A0ABQ4UC05_9HYPH|nr:hypothetical protein [Methylorubrum aminovorans]GJE63705.1 hypothetical protein LNAOJCKE_0903 [Methylorubrum aminovorans]GMA79822.1 hypothetical protein GCM10025880_62390 [Methylorubrum aminovorans]